MHPTRAYLLTSGRLYLTTGDCSGCEPGNLYPCSLGAVPMQSRRLFPGAITCRNGDTLDMFGRRYEVNSLPTQGDCDDEIDLELVLLCEPGDPEAADLCPACGLELDMRHRCPDGPLCGTDHEAYAVSLGMVPRRDHTCGACGGPVAPEAGLCPYCPTTTAGDND